MGRLLVLFCIPLVELKFDIMKGYGVYAKPGIAKKKSESNVKMLFADSYCDIPSILIPPSCLQVFVGEEGNSKQKDMTRTTGRCGKSIFIHTFCLHKSALHSS